MVQQLLPALGVGIVEGSLQSFVLFHQIQLLLFRKQPVGAAGLVAEPLRHQLGPVAIKVARLVRGDALICVPVEFLEAGGVGLVYHVQHRPEALPPAVGNVVLLIVPGLGLRGGGDALVFLENQPEPFLVQYSGPFFLGTAQLSDGGKARLRVAAFVDPFHAADSHPSAEHNHHCHQSQGNFAADGAEYLL